VALPYLALIAVVAGFANYFWFYTESVNVGDALNGYQRAGHFFLASHGTYTEVSQAAWEWSRIHAISVFVTHPLALAGGAYLLFRFVFPAMMTGGTGLVIMNERAQGIRDSGRVLATARCAGQVGEVRFSGPLLNVSVFPGGVVVKPVFMREYSIPKPEIRSVRDKRSLFGRRIEVEHTGVGSLSPLVLYVSPESSIARAIRGLPGSETIVPGVPATGVQPVGHNPPLPIRVMGIAGLAASVVLIGAGVVWAIPTFGLFGVFWTGWATVIAVVNLRRFQRRGF
jgi:hypothetical protein